MKKYIKISLALFSVFTTVFLVCSNTSSAISARSIKDISGNNRTLSFVTQIDNSTTISYMVYTPSDYKPGKRTPLLMFLHGGGQTGSNIKKVEEHGPHKLIASGRSFPFIVVSPLLPYKFASKWEPKLVDEIYEHVKQNFSIDTSKFYLTGISLGGGGTWYYAIEYPQKVAAIAPISGWGNPSRACEMRNVPVWAFHGANDNTVNMSGTSNMINSLKKCGSHPTYTIYPNTGHDAWTATYNNPKLYEWFRKHSLDTAPPLSNPETSKNNIGRDQRNRVQVDLRKVVSLPVSLKESSGLEVESVNSFWSINDSGGLPAIINFDTLGKVLSIKKISGAANVDWEDLTQDDENLYVGDFGNNENSRRELQIYRIPLPWKILGERIKAETIRFSLPDQNEFPPTIDQRNFDIEAMVHFNDSLFLFTKNNTSPYTGICKIYKIPATPGFFEATMVDNIELGNQSLLHNSVTSAVLTPDKKHLLLLTYSKIYIFSCFPGSNFFLGTKKEMDFAAASQKESISISNDNKIWITDEKSFNLIGGNLYNASLENLLKTVQCE